MEKINYAKFYLFSELEALLKEFASLYPENMRLSSLGKTDLGRDIYLVEIADDINSEENKNKPAYYIQSSVHCSEPAGGTVSLHFMETLLTKKPDILKDVVFYIIPRVNPDGVEALLTTNAQMRSKNALDPRAKENALLAKDMDGDGLVLSMRKKNPLGNYKEIAPGVMAIREPGETDGVYYDMYTEGEFTNYNGTVEYINAERMYDFNRCTPSLWKPMATSSEYPLRFTENRVVAEFLVTHPNIFAGLDFHNGTNGILRSPMAEDSAIDPRDLDLIMSIGTLASEMTGFPLISEYRYGSVPHVLPGCSNQFAYDVLGISHFVVELGNGYNDIGMKSMEYIMHPKKDYLNPEVLAYTEKEGYKAFYEFKPFNHPQLGEVEIGGMRWSHGYMQNPKTVEKIVPKTTEFMLKHASLGPRLVIGDAECLNVGGDVYRVRAQVKNIGYMGTKVIQGTDSYQASFPVDIYIEKDEKVEVLSRPNVYQVPKLDSLQDTYVEWFIKKPADVKISIIADHPKANTAKVTL